MIPVKYIGVRPTYREGAYGSGIFFERGQTVLIEDDDLARKLLRHPDVYVPGESEAATETAPKKEAKKVNEEEENTQNVRDSIATMNKGALETFAKTNFRVDIDKRRSLADLRSEVTTLVDRFGVS